jgi:hypothetical protein
LRWASAGIDQFERFDKKGAAETAPRDRRADYIGQIFQITPVPGIWTSGPFAAPTKCVSALLSRTAP